MVRGDGKGLGLFYFVGFVSGVWGGGEGGGRCRVRLVGWLVGG